MLYIFWWWCTLCEVNRGPVFTPTQSTSRTLFVSLSRTFVCLVFPLFSLFFSLFTPWFHPPHPLIPVMTTMGWICHSSGLSPLLPLPAVFTASRHTRRPWSNKKTPRCASGQWGRRGVWGFFCSVIKRAHLFPLVNTHRGGVACVCGPLGMPVDGGACLFVDLS